MPGDVAGRVVDDLADVGVVPSQELQHALRLARHPGALSLAVRRRLPDDARIAVNVFGVDVLFREDGCSGRDARLADVAPGRVPRPSGIRFN